MKKRAEIAHRVIVVLAMITLLLSGSIPASAGGGNVAIDKVRLDFNAAFNKGNAQGIGDLLDERAIWLPPGKPQIVGKDKVTAHYANYFAKLRARFELKPGTILESDGWAFMHGDFSRADTPIAGGDTRQVSGHYLLVLKKQADGGWKIVRDIWND